MNKLNNTYVPYQCYQELFKKYETNRLILERTNQNINDYAFLAKIILNRKVNKYFQRPIMYLENYEKAYEYIQWHANNSVSFTIKIKNENSNPIVIGQIGFYYIDKINFKDIGVFYFIGEEYQRKGYAGEAACPLIRHLFDNIPLTSIIKIDFEKNNIGSRKVALKICNDILKYHSNYLFGELEPFTEKYYLLKNPPINGKVNYFFDGLERKCYVSYPKDYFNYSEYFEVSSEGYFIKKQ